MNKPEKVFPIAHIHYDDEIDGKRQGSGAERGVQEAIKTLIRWSGDDPAREGPARYAGA